MRLKRLETGHGLVGRLKLAFRRLRGRTPTDVDRLVLYRPRYFGDRFVRWLRPTMRGPSGWSIGERELFAAFVSKLNQCGYCAGGHRDNALRMLPSDLVDRVWSRERLEGSGKLEAALSFLERLTLAPASVGSDDVVTLRKAGLAESEIEDLIHICALFSMINRLADAFDFAT